MLPALRLARQTLRHLNFRGYIYIWANLLWFVLSLPIITAPAAWAGLIYMSRQAHLAPTVEISDFWQGFRSNLKRGAVMALLNVVIIAINLVNLLAYRNQTDLLVLGLRWTWVAALVVWVMLQFYMWPLLYELKQPSLVGAFRNAAIMLLRNPLYSFTLFIFILLLVVSSTVLVGAWALITASALAALSTGAVLERLAAAGLRPPLRPPEIAATDFHVSDAE
jgi:uncharacterized membrane protein YesL